MAEQVDHGPRIGADPELFVRTTSPVTMGKKVTYPIVPICGRLGGTKDHPRIIPQSEYGKHPYGQRIMLDGRGVGGFAVQEDNVMFEFNIPASHRSDYFSNNVQFFIQYVTSAILEKLKLQFTWENHYNFRSQDLTHPLSKTVGCSPDFCAYNPADSLGRPALAIEELKTHRYCGGHIHVQYNHGNVPRDKFVKFLDLVVSLAYLNKDRQPGRRQFYGKAGVFRPTPYGVEYRTPSNFWLTPDSFSHDLPKYIAENVLALARMANTDVEALVNFYHRVPWPDVKDAIDSENIKLAKEIINYVMAYTPIPILNTHGASGSYNL